MKTRQLLLILVVGFAPLVAARADALPHMEFVQGLRDNRYPDLALEYLQNMSKNPPPELAVILPLEIAKTRLEIASLASDPSEQLTLYAQARKEFEDFVQKNGAHPLAANANFEIARIIGLQGKAQLTKARQQETSAARQVEAQAARKLFTEAIDRLKDAMKQIEVKLAGLDNPQTPEDRAAYAALLQSQLQAEFEIGMNQLEMAQSYIGGGTKDNLDRANVIQSAIATFNQVAAKDQRSPISWKAKAWIGRANEAIDKPADARQQYQEILRAEGAQVEEAKRLARYFDIRLITKAIDEKNPLPKVQAACEEWLRLYPNYRDTPEGYGVRWELASALFDQAFKLPPDPNTKKPTPQALALYDRAKRIYKDLADVEHEFTQRSARNYRRIILITAVQTTDNDPTKAKTFEDAYVLAQYASALIEEGETKLKEARDKLPEEPLPAQLEKIKEQEKKFEEDKKKHYQTMIAALKRALELVNQDVTPKEVMDVRSMLSYVYLLVDDPYQAALWGEFVARSNPKASRAGASAAYALQAYLILVDRAERAKDTAKLPADRRRLRDMAEFIINHWPNDNSGNLARHQLGMMQIKEAEQVQVPKELEAKFATYLADDPSWAPYVTHISETIRRAGMLDKYQKAAEWLDGISPNYLQNVIARYQLALTLREMVVIADRIQLQDVQKNNIRTLVDKVIRKQLQDSEPNSPYLALLSDEKINQGLDPLTPAQKKALQQRMLKVLEDMPEVPDTIDVHTGQLYIQAKLLQGQLLFEFKRYDELDTLAQFLMKKLASLNLPADTEESLRPWVKATGLYSIYGRANEAYMAGQYNQVIDLNKSVITDLEQQTKEGEIDETNLQIYKALTVLVLRTLVQMDNLNEAQRIVGLLQHLTAQEQIGGGFIGIMMQIVSQLKDQVVELESKGDAAKEQLEKTKTSFAAFLDTLAKEKDLKTDYRIFLANSYLSIGKAQQAAELLANVTPPKAMDGQPIDQREQQFYYGARMTYLRALREHAAAQEEGDARKEALETYRNELIKVSQEKWAEKRLDLRKEKIYLLQLREYYGGQDGAVMQWFNLMNAIPKPFRDNQMELEYYEIYYNFAYCYFKNAMKIDDPTKKDEALKRAAYFIKKLEDQKADMGSDSLKRRYMRLLRDEPLLLKQYKEHDGKVCLPPDAAKTADAAKPAAE
ncbi:MAG: hypothetical protein ACK4RK_04240 [Gemmataceae bacterium]